jgi:hypothetical protein
LVPSVVKYAAVAIDPMYKSGIGYDEPKAVGIHALPKVIGTIITHAPGTADACETHAQPVEGSIASPVLAPLHSRRPSQMVAAWTFPSRRTLSD